MAEPEVSYHAKDIILKHVVTTLGNDLGRRFGIKMATVLARLPSDLPILEVRAQYPDILLALTDDTIQHWELQSGHSREDLLRFGDYSWSAYRLYGKPVETIVLYGPEVTTIPESIIQAGGHVFRVTNILLSRHDGEATAARLRAKVGRNEPLDGVDRVDLALAALMRHIRPLREVVRDLVPVVEALPTAERGDMMGTIVGLSYHYLQADAAMSILEALKMSNVLEQLIGEGIVKGRVEGELEGKRASLRRVLIAKFGTVPVGLEQRIAAAGGEILDQLIIRAATADRIDLI